MLALMIARTGPGVIWAALRPAWRWMPIAALFEALRLGTEMLSTYFAYGRRAKLIPVSMLTRAHLVAYAAGSVMPAGRAAGEATKIAFLKRYTGVAAASSVAATNQAVTLLAASVVSIPCAFAAYQLTGVSAVTIGLAIHALVIGGLGVGVRVSTRAHRLRGPISKYFSRYAGDPEGFHETSHEIGLIPVGSTISMVLGRFFQVAVYAVLAHAVGIDVSPARAFYAQGINMIALAVGVLVPGQLGASDGAFALSAAPLGTTVARAMSIALLAHVLQIAWVAVGSLVLLAWKAKPNRS